MASQHRPKQGHPKQGRPGAAPAGSPPTPGTKVTGTFQATSRGIGYLVPDTGDWGDVKVPRAATGVALHGDRVQVEILRVRGERQPTGAVVRVLNHAHRRFVGRVAHHGRTAVVLPKNPKINRTLEIGRRVDPEEAPDGAWVVAEVTRWSASPNEPLGGKIVEVLGVDGDRGLPILLLIRGAGVPDAFPAAVEREAEGLAAGAERAAARGRRDFRGDRIVTIDPATAKDFDDAVGLIEAGADGWRVGVHIADVAHYVRPGTALDDEAYARSTSIYPVDRVIPMLPEALSNQLCSLRPDEEKLTMTAVFTITPSGAVRDIELSNSRIRSVHRFAYEQVQALFDEADREAGHEIPADRRLAIPSIDDELHGDLMGLRMAARALSAARFGRGALDLDLPEPVFEFDAEGRPVRLAEAPHYEAHRLIEELMIAANEAVARELERRGYPALYRVHEEPSATRANEIAPALARVGIPMPAAGLLDRAQLQAILNLAHSHPAARIIQRWILRTLMRARYQPENIGHFGLASQNYLHFTSPIRRYPDLIVHRIVKAMLDGVKPDDPAMREVATRLPEWGKHTTLREEVAQKVEWNAEEIMALDYMRRHHLGDVFEAFVAGVNPMGFFVALTDYPVEGLVRIGSIGGEYFELDEEYHIWRSRSSGATIAMGDRVTVAVERIDVLAGQMDLRLVRRKEGAAGARAGGRPAREKGRGTGSGKFERRRGRGRR
jgi:ribonuclease R